MKSLSIEQYTDLINAIKRNEKGGRLARNIALMELAYYLGLRASEVGLLHTSDVNLSNRTITVNNVLKNGVTGIQYDLPPHIFKLVKAWIEHLPPNYKGPLFPSQQRKAGGVALKGISRQQLDKLMKNYGALARLPDHLRHMHVLRHTTGTHLRLLGKDLPTIQKWLRHKNGGSTMIYQDVGQAEANAAGADLINFRTGKNKIKWS